MTTIHRSKERINKTGEVFTPSPLVEEMLSTLSPDVFIDPTKTFLDPAAGDGNFLVAVLNRKIANGINPIQALHTIYGVELMPDNVVECRRRLQEIILSIDSRPTIVKATDKILNHNIVCHDSLTWDYDAWQPLPLKK